MPDFLLDSDNGVLGLIWLLEVGSHVFGIVVVEEKLGAGLDVVTGI